MKSIAKRLHRNTCKAHSFLANRYPSPSSKFELCLKLGLESSLCFLVSFLRANAPLPKTWHANISPKQVSLYFWSRFAVCRVFGPLMDIVTDISVSLSFLTSVKDIQKHPTTFYTCHSHRLNGCIETTVFNSLVYVVISSFLVLALSLPVQAFFLEDLGIEDLNATLSVQNARKYATSGKVGQPSQFDSVHVDDVKNQPGPCTLGSLGTVGHIDGGEYRDDQCLNVCWCPTMCPIYMCKAVAMLRFACRSRRASIFLQVVFS